MDLYSVLLARMGGAGGADIPETTALLKGDGAGGAVAAISGTDYVPPNTTGDLYMSASGEFNFLSGADINFETEHGFSFKYNGSEIAKKTDIPTYTPGTGISIVNGVISCTFADGNGVSY